MATIIAIRLWAKAFTRSSRSKNCKISKEVTPPSSKAKFTSKKAYPPIFPTVTRQGLDQAGRSIWHRLSWVRTGPPKEAEAKGSLRKKARTTRRVPQPAYSLYCSPVSSSKSQELSSSSMPSHSLRSLTPPKQKCCSTSARKWAQKWPSSTSRKWQSRCSSAIAVLWNAMRTSKYSRWFISGSSPIIICACRRLWMFLQSTASSAPPWTKRIPVCTYTAMKCSSLPSRLTSLSGWRTKNCSFGASVSSSSAPSATWSSAVGLLSFQRSRTSRWWKCRERWSATCPLAAKLKGGLYTKMLATISRAVEIAACTSRPQKPLIWQMDGKQPTTSNKKIGLQDMIITFKGLT